MHCLPLCSTSDFLGRSRFTTLWVTLACCRIAATSYVQNSSLGGKGLLARVTQTRPDQELIQCWWTNPVLWLTCIRAISHSDTHYTSLSPPSPPPIFDSQCTRHGGIMQDYSLLQLTERSLTLWKVFSVTSDHHCLVWRWLYFIFSISILSLSVKQFSCTWLAVIIVSFEISLMCYVCSPFLTRKHLLLNSELWRP